MKTGTYRIEVMRWPAESGKAINEELVPGANVPGESKAFRAQVGQAINGQVRNLALEWEGS